MEVCIVLEERYKNALIWKNLWTMLLFLVGVALLMTVVNLVFNAGNTELVDNVNKGLTIVIEGTALTWMASQRKKSAEEENEAKKDLIDNCQDRGRLQKIESRYGNLF